MARGPQGALGHRLNDNKGPDRPVAARGLRRADRETTDRTRGRCRVRTRSRQQYSLVGGWYSITYTPPDRLTEAFAELTRVLIPGGYALLALEADGEPVQRADAQVRPLPLTSHGHTVQELLSYLEDSGLKIDATVLRAADLEDETTPQAFVIARRPLLQPLSRLLHRASESRESGSSPLSSTGCFIWSGPVLDPR